MITESANLVNVNDMNDSNSQIVLFKVYIPVKSATFIVF